MGRRGPKKRDSSSTRLILGDGRIVLGGSREMDALYHRIQALPRGTKFRTVAAWLISGARMEVHVPEKELDEIRQAAEDIAANFVV